MRLERSPRLVLTAAVAVAVASAAGVAGLASASAAPTATVHIKNIDFSPHTLKVKKGTTVRWTFEDASTPHNVTSRGGNKFKSSHTQQSGSYSVRFTKPGTYSYVCTIHFNMKAKVVVR